ncbi:NUDIX hydrolase [Kribbella deserti]|uniref:NUDIX hydrolase n=1 Tax=Kribbella deserti TaxID=1926257 RepID=A0ABV6QYE5_9ACTN
MTLADGNALPDDGLADDGLPAAGVLHADAVGVLGRWTPPDAEQARLREYYQRHLAAYDDAMTRARLPEHLTASALVVDRAGERVLLTLHGKIHRWLQLGGHCEPGDQTLAGAALREATEESGLPGLTIGDQPLLLSRHQVRCGGRDDAFHLDVQYLVRSGADEAFVVSSESSDLAWFPIERLPAGIDASVAELARRARELVG